MPDERKKSMPPDPAKRAGQEKLGQDLLVQLQHDFVKKKAEDAGQLANFGQALLGKVAQDFASNRPPPMPEPSRAPSAPPTREGPISLAPPPSPELVRAEAELARAAVSPLRPDEDAEVAAMQGGGLFGFFRRLFRRR